MSSNSPAGARSPKALLIKRLSIVIACYLLSGLGLLFAFVAAFAAIRERSPISIIWILAWGMHLFMSGTWVADRHLPRAWAALGAALIASSFAALPIAALFMDTRSVSDNFLGALKLDLVELVYVSPCLILAAWLVRFHWRGPVLQLPNGEERKTGQELV